MKSMILFLFLVLSANAIASTGRAFGLLNTSMSLTDHGSLDSGDDFRFEADMKGMGLGIGGEYNFTQNSDGINFSSGFIYEFQRGVDQVTGITNGDTISSQDDVLRIQMTTIYANGYFPVVDKVSFVAGISYHIADIVSRGDWKGYEIESGPGFQFGVDLKLQNNFFAQMLHRRIVLNSKDDIFKGKVDLSNLSLLVGKDF